MTNYFELWKAYITNQQQAAASLAALGLLLAGGWLLIGKLVPPRWQPAIQTTYIVALLGLGLLLGLGVSGG